MTAPFQRDTPPVWKGEGLENWHEYKINIERWFAARLCNEEYACARLHLTYMMHGTLDQLYRSLDQERLVTRQRQPRNLKDFPGWRPTHADGTLNWALAYENFRHHDHQAGNVDEESVESYDSADEADRIAFTCGVPYLLERMGAQFEKSERNTFSAKFRRLFNLRRNGRDLVTWLNDFKAAKSELMVDPISEGRMDLPEFVWCNWLLETAELRPETRVTIDTRMPEWKAVTMDRLEIQMRDLMQRPEIPEHRAGTTRSSSVRFTEEHEEGFDDDCEDQEDVFLVWSDTYQQEVLWNDTLGVYDNSGDPHDPAYHESSPDAWGETAWHSTVDGVTYWRVDDDSEIEDTPENLHYSMFVNSPITLAEANEAIWAPDYEGVLECLAVYPRGGNPSRTKPGRHEKEGDGATRKNKDGLTCHRCNGDNHFGNNCPTEKSRTPTKGRKGKSKGRSKGKGTKGFTAWESEACSDALWGKGGKKGRRKGKGRPKGKGKGKSRKGKKGGFRPVGKGSFWAEDAEQFHPSEWADTSSYGYFVGSTQPHALDDSEDFAVLPITDSAGWTSEAIEYAGTTMWERIMPVQPIEKEPEATTFYGSASSN